MTRIVGGVAGGRRLTVPPGREVRPTSERVREALASALEARLGGPGGLRGRTVLDLFAGTGAVGLELLSRGAEAVTLVESAPSVRKVLQANVAALGLVGATVVAGRAETVLREHDGAWDIVFLDPPYALDVQPILDAAAAAHPPSARPRAGHAQPRPLLARRVRAAAPPSLRGQHALVRFSIMCGDRR